MADITVEAGGLKFVSEYRAAGADRGPAIRVFGKVAGEDKQVLRFDCFDNDPHYHYDPTGMDAFHRMDRAVTPDVVAFSLVMIRDNIKPMVTAAGYPALADTLDTEAIGHSIGEIRAALEKAEAEA